MAETSHYQVFYGGQQKKGAERNVFDGCQQNFFVCEKDCVISSYAVDVISHFQVLKTQIAWACSWLTTNASKVRRIVEPPFDCSNCVVSLATGVGQFSCLPLCLCQRFDEKLFLTLEYGRVVFMRIRRFACGCIRTNVCLFICLSDSHNLKIITNGVFYRLVEVIDE